MSKKIWIAIGSGVIIAVIGIIGTVLFVSNIQKNQTPEKSFAKVPQVSPKQEETSIPDQTYQDTSGFSFQYPGGLIVTDTTPQDPSYYTQVTLKKDGEALVIGVRDSAVPSYSNPIAAITLSGLPAKQYKLDGRFVTMAYDQGVLYTIDAPSDDPFWSLVNDRIVSTFSFGTQTSSQNTNAIYEEETIE